MRATDAANNLGPYSNTASGTTSAGSGGLVAAYAFDEGSGSTVSDTSGQGNHGSLVGGATWTTAGKYSGALSFNGTNAGVLIPDSASLRLSSGMTLMGWVRPSSTGTNWRGIIFKRATGGQDNYFLEASSSFSGSPPAGGGRFGGVSALVSAPSPVTTNAWSHVALTYDGATLTLYVNAQQVASTPRTGAILQSNGPVTIGGSAVYGQWFAGIIDEIRIYDVALTPAQVQSDMNTALGGGTDTQPPTAPGGVSATAAGVSQINLSWTAATDNVGVTGYLVERCPGAACANFAQVGTSASTAYSDPGLTGGTTYQYRVRASDAATNLGPYSNTASATTAAGSDTQAPTAPSGLAATVVGSTQVDLSWTAATDNVGVTGYRVERCQGVGCGSFAEVATPVGTVFSDTGRTPSTSYSYRVRATDAAGNLGPYSGTASATTAAGSDTQAPTAPSGLAATAVGSTQINVSWGAATDNVGVTGYRVERCQGVGCGSFAEVATPAGTSYSDTGPAASTSYSYRVRATDAAGNLGPYSGTASATTAAATDTQAPTAPGTLTVSVASASQLDLSWGAATDNVGVTGYLVERCQGSGCASFTQIAAPSGTSFADTGRAASTSYSYRVRATDAANNLGPYSNTASGTTSAGSGGLVAAYAFDEGSGTTVSDTSGQGNHGSLVGGATWTTSGKYNGAISFNGTNAGVLIPDSASLRLSSGMTLMGWVRPSSTGTNWRGIIFKRATGGQDNYFLEASSSFSGSPPAGGGRFGGVSALVSAPSPVTTNAWSHVALTYDGATLTLYVNAQQVASTPRTGAILQSNGPVTIGGSAVYGQWFAGIIDEIRIYDVALTPGAGPVGHEHGARGRDGYAAADGAERRERDGGGGEPDRPELDGGDRQRGRDELPGGALPGRGVCELRPGGDVGEHGVLRSGTDGGYDVPVPGAGQ